MSNFKNKILFATTKKSAQCTYSYSAGDDAVVDIVVIEVGVTVDGENFMRRVMTPQLLPSATVDSQQTAQTGSNAVKVDIANNIRNVVTFRAWT